MNPRAESSAPRNRRARDASGNGRYYIGGVKKGLSETTSPYEGLIQKTPGVCGGRACIRGTRIPVWQLVEHRAFGRTDETLLEAFPALTRDGLRAAWDDYETNRAEIDAAIAENDIDDV